MNNYKQPEIEVIKFELSDIITTSTPSVEENGEHDNAFGDITDLFKGK